MKGEKGIGGAVTTTDGLSEELQMANNKMLWFIQHHINRFLVFNKFSFHDLKKW